MNYKIKGALEKSKLVTLIMIAIWITLTVLFTSPIATSLVETRQIQGADSNVFFDIFFRNITDIGGNLGKIFKPSYAGTFWKVEMYVSIGVIFMYIVGLIKSMPKNEYSGIENGSSDWASRRTI